MGNRQGVDIHGLHHNAGDAQLLVDALDHVLLVDTLVIAADEVAVEVQVEVVDGLDLGQRLVDEDVIHIEGVLGQHHAGLTQHLGAVDDAVHQDVLVRRKVADLAPLKDAALRQDAGIIHDIACVISHMLVHIVGHDQIDRLFGGSLGAQHIHNLGQGVTVQPVVRIDHLKVHAGGVADALVDTLAVAAVLLMDHADDGGVLFGVGIGDFAGVILGAVIHQDDFGFLAGGQQCLDAVVHISGRIVARHGKGDKFHK